MTGLTRTLRRAFAGTMLALALAIAAPGATTPAHAQAPAPSAPAQASEQMLFNYLQGDVRGRITIPDQRAATLIQPEGREFQHFWRTTLKWIGAIAVGGMLVVLVLFYAMRGKIRIDGGPSGRTIERFNGFERFVHWLTATTFIVLGITGLNISFGRELLLPLMGPEAFTTWSQWGKLAHNFLAFPFTLGILLMLVIWIRDNIPGATDVRWFAEGGGLIGHGHPPARRFNAGQKIIFWSVVLGGGAIAVTGFILMFPFQFVTTMSGMQLATQLHGVIALVMIAIILAHIYIGSLGMEGAFDAMGSGQVDLNWAKEHHSLWVEEVMAGSRDARAPTGARGAGAD
ncbi:formate dehydrogenase subunit gamma [Elioraea rosea]|uniref:formate dehydrogenase subunit gamma n=1 Tax=Elioraea rosea TaxID=2492390 RepID=UPI0011824C5A|nr:formate dehydrogenase subunit gamma [Elioraea rosea]